MVQQIAVRLSDDGGKCLHGWKFVKMEHIRFTYQQLWQDIRSDELHFELNTPCRNYELMDAWASATLGSEPQVRGDPNTDIVEVANVFGMPFFTLTLKHSSTCDICHQVVEQGNALPSAFTVMMNAARNAVGKDIPQAVNEPTTNKERLRNAILAYFEDQSCKFPTTCNGASAYVSSLTELLYYLDGQYSKIEAVIGSGEHVPKVFKEKLSGFNAPEKSKHRKRTLDNLSEKKLETLTVQMREVMQGQHYMERMPWAQVRLQILDLVQLIEQYCVHLRAQCTRQKIAHATPRSQLELSTNVKVVNPRKGPIHFHLAKLDKELASKDLYHPVAAREFLPTCDRRRTYELIQELTYGLSMKFVYYVHHIGSNKPSFHFVWRIGDNEPEGTVINKCTQVIRKVEADVPIYERRITKRNFMLAFGFVAEPVALRSIFTQLTNDKSAPVDLNEGEIDRRFTHAMLSEDPGILVDLRHLPPDVKKDSFREFFNETERYLSEEVGVACQERRHGEQLYLAKAISLPDLHKRIVERVPAGTKIPSLKWLRYQFQPVNPRANTSKYFKGSMNIKMMVQKRQVRVNHIDAHYCAAAWRYMREFAVLHKELVSLVSMDDKHKVKVGEPDYPLAAAERGKKVIVGPNQVMAVGDHDFSKCTLTPSVNFLIDIPGSIEGSFYRGDVFISFKDSVLQPSSPFRHASELKDILQQREDVPPILLIYTDGGPDHRCTYMSVKLSMISVFLELNLDKVIALRTAPSNSWANPVERIMSLVNNGLQGVGVMRQKGNADFEKAIGNASNMKEMREKLSTDALRQSFTESLERPVDLLSSQMLRLSLKDRPFQTFQAATEDDIERLWQKCLQIEERLQRDHLTPKDVKNLDRLNAFLDHCCIQGHYVFQVQKCGKRDCTICLALRDERCLEVDCLPFPVPSGDGHYKPFHEVYRTKTTEARPSKQKRPNAQRKKVPFSPSVQHCKNTDIMVQCSECNKWRLVFSKKKLLPNQRRQLTEILDDVEYTCGFLFDDLVLPHGMNVFVKDHDCEDHIEKLFYSCGYEPCCIQCGVDLHGVVDNEDTYPQCDDCPQEQIKKRI